ncbi:MAG: glycosyl hydrolase family 28-related protein [Armatimonadota bacterium]|nr:glycosyl hydrolase family 28-related protein [Armatimonadota bacterium]
MMKRLSIATTVIAAVAITFALRPLSGSCEQPTSVIDVKSFGAAGDGEKDDTEAFAKAIAASAQKGLQVYVPPGKYRISKGLALDKQTLKGADICSWGADDVSMPTIISSVNDAPTFRLTKGACIHGLNIVYDWKGAEPSPTPPIIEISGIGCRISEVRIQNAWDAIIADGKSNVGRTCVERCFIVDCHHIGVRITGTWDVSWISKVEVWSPASKSFPTIGIGFQFGKNDVLLVSDCFVYRANVGYQLVDEIPGCSVKGGTWGTFSNCVSDFCSTGFEIKGTHTVSIAGGSHWSHFGGLIVRSGNSQVRISAAEIAANAAPALTVEGGDLVTLSSCQIRRVQAGRDFPAVRITNGKSCVITGCVVVSSTKAFDIEPSLKDVIVSNNVIRENAETE